MSIRLASLFNNGWRRHLIALAVSLSCFGLDLITKLWAQRSLPQNESLAFLPPLLRFTLVTNTGAAFSLGRDNAYLVVLVSTAVFITLLFWSVQRYWSPVGAQAQPFLEEIGMAMILGSAFGNLIDRYWHGRVTDFLEFAFITFPVFNVADVLIDVGIGLVIIAMFKSGIKQLPADNV